MEGILRESDLSEIERLFESSFDLDGDLVYYPVRHHSPACAWHLARLIERYDPETILIEGPSDSTSLLPYIADRASEPPFCIYYSFDDRTGQVSDEKERYRAYYPFLSYSPELVAIRAAADRGIPVRFIDLPYADRLLNRPEREAGETRFLYNEDTEYEANSYTVRLARGSGCRDFTEFWESRFELGAMETETRAFVKRLFCLGYFMRLATPDTALSLQEDRLRERYMAEHIREERGSGLRILVVTGAFHVAGLMERLSGETTENDSQSDKKATWILPTKGTTASYLMPYTFREADSRSGYAAGMVFPAFYQSVWNNMQKTKPAGGDPYGPVLLEYIVRTARFIRKTHPVSLPDEIQALHLARSLAALRGKRAPGVYELLEGVGSAFVKGDRHTTSTSELDFLLRQLSGLGAGRIALDACVPPVVQDFRALCSAYRIKTSNVDRQPVMLEIVKNPTHRRKSRFLHRMLFLETDFAFFQSGPDYVNRRDRNLVRESWVCRYSPTVETRLIDLSVYGTTVTEVCTSLVAKSFDDRCMTTTELGSLLISVQVMGIESFYTLHESAIREVIDREENFSSLCLFLENLHELTHIQLLMDGTENPLLPELGRTVWAKAIHRIAAVKRATANEEERVCEAMHSLYGFLASGAPWSEAENFTQAVDDVLEDAFCNSRFYGLCLAIRYDMGALDQAVFGDRIATYLESCLSRPDQAASFICGLFLVAHDILFLDDRILQTIERVIGHTDDETFLTILPDLRYAFTGFLPSELGRLGEAVARAHGFAPTRLSGSTVVSESEVVEAMRADGAAARELNRWGL